MKEDLYKATDDAQNPDDNADDYEFADKGSVSWDVARKVVARQRGVLRSAYAQKAFRAGNRETGASKAFELGVSQSIKGGWAVTVQGAVELARITIHHSDRAAAFLPEDQGGRLGGGRRRRRRDGAISAVETAGRGVTVRVALSVTDVRAWATGGAISRRRRGTYAHGVCQDRLVALAKLLSWVPGHEV